MKSEKKNVGIGAIVLGTVSLVISVSTAASAAFSADGKGGGGKPAAAPATVAGSAYVAGYDVTPAHAFASASATFVVPKVTCTSTDTDEDFGLSNADPATEGNGASELAAVFVTCDNGIATYYYDALANGETNTQTGVNPGDTVQVSIFQTSSLEETKVFDITANHYYDAYDAPAGNTSIAIGISSVIPVAQFTKASFTQVQVNGQYLSFEPDVAYDLMAGATTLAKTSAIPFNGDSFSVKLKAAN